MQDVSIEGESNLSVAVQIAQLALKHRENKNQRQRIVIFVGSPIKEDKDALVKIAKKLKKNNVAVDIVAFGSEEENGEKLEAFHAAVNSNDNSNLVTVPPGTILSDMLFSTPIFMEESAMAAAAGGEGGGGSTPAAPRANVVDGFDYGELGVDPTLDPELALALRVSMEEEKARQAAQNQAAGVAGGDGGEGSGSGEVAAAVCGEGTATKAATGGGEEMMIDAMDEDALLQQALAMSMAGASGTDAAKTPAADAPTQMQQQQGATPPAAPTKAGGGDVAMDEIDDPELALALQMSMAETQPGEEKKEGEEEEKK